MHALKTRSIALVLLSAVFLVGCPRDDVSGRSAKQLRVALDSDIKGFDPAMSADEYSHAAVIQIYQPLYQYNYVKRPYQIEPLLATSMPEISGDGRTYTIHLRPDVFFHDDPAFGRKGRPLKAEDVIYTLQRLSEPGMKSPNAWMLDGRIEALSAPNDRTIQIRLVRPYKQLIYALASQATAVVAREVVEKYGEEFLNHPVGTGPFILRQWVRGQKIVLERNPGYWKELREDAGEGSPLPRIDRVEIAILTETQPRWLNFLKGNLDYVAIPREAYDDVFDPNMTAKADFLNRGIVISRESNQDVVYLFMNLSDPLLGRNRDLRKAISMAVNRKEKLDLFYRVRGIVAQGPIPPDFFGYDAAMKDPNGFDLSKARAHMEKARSFHRSHGGKGAIPPVTIDLLNGSFDRQLGEALARDLAAIGLKTHLRFSSWPQFEQRAKKKDFQIGFQSWMADYPDPENFLQLFYGKNVAPGPNASNFQHSDYDRLYESMRNMEDGPKRAGIIRKMVALIHEEVPWVFLVHRLKTSASHGWLKNFRYHAIEKGSYKYLEIDSARKQQLLPRLQ